MTYGTFFHEKIFFYLFPFFFVGSSLSHARWHVFFSFAMFQLFTPEHEEETRKAVDNLKRPVNDLNEKLPEFNWLVGIGLVRFAKTDFEIMPEDYNRDFHEWLQKGAINDFITKMATKYKHFDADLHAEEGGNPNDYVTLEKRRVILGGLGSIWIDLPMTGTVHGTQVTKWTRAAFVYTDGTWRVFFDPTVDDCTFKQVEESNKYAKQMMTAGVDVDLE